MKIRFSMNWAGPAALVLLGVGGFYAFYQFTPDHLFASPGPQAAITNATSGRQAAITHTKGEAMQTQVQNTVLHANEESFGDEVLKSQVPVLVDFYADWCGPCRALGPVLEEVARETPDAKVVKVNVDESPQLAAEYGISSIPNLLVFEDGKIAGQQVGLASKQQLKSLLAGAGDER
jgi:thioredoxin 1